MAFAPNAGAPVMVSEGDAQVRKESRQPFEYRAEVAASRLSRVRLPYAWYPGWTLRVDGRPADTRPAEGNGLIEFAAPAGTHEVNLRFGRSRDRGVGEAISLFAAIALGASRRWWRMPMRQLSRAAAASAD